MRILRNILVAASLVAAVAPSTALALANDPDVIVHDDAGDPQRGGRTFDMAYASDGTLCGAWVVVDPAAGDRLVIASSSDIGRSWRILDQRQYQALEILDVSVAVASGYPTADKMVYVAVHTFKPGTGTGSITCFSRSYVRPSGLWPTYSWPVASLDATEAAGDKNLGTAVIPMGTGPAAGYSVAVAFEKSDKVYVAYRTGATSSISSSASPSPRLVAGPGGMIDTGGRYGHPSIVASKVSGPSGTIAEVAIAFEDRTLGVCRIASAFAVDHIRRGDPFVPLYTTPANDGRPEHHPVLAAAHDADDLPALNFTCLAGNADPATGGYLLTWYFGEWVLGWSFQEMPPLHERALSAGDIDVTDRKAYVVALCSVGGASAVLAFEGDRDPPSSGAPQPLRTERVNDVAVTTTEPKVARSPQSAPFASRGYGYCALPPGKWGVPEEDGDILIDP